MCTDSSWRVGQRVCCLLLGLLALASCSRATVASSTPPAQPLSVGTDCFPATVFTAQAMQQRVDCHPDAYKIMITPETTVLFAFPDSHMDWAGPVFIVHIPSVSEAILKTDGTLFQHAYTSDEARLAIEAVLNDPARMAQIRARAAAIMAGNPAPYTTIR